MEKQYLGVNIPAAVIVRPAYEIEMFGGPDQVQIKIGTRVRVHPATDLFMQGAKYAEVRRIRDIYGTIYFDVRPEVMGRPIKGRLRVLKSTDVLVDEHGLGRW